MFDRVVVANRGAVAARVLRALNALRVRSIAVYSEADAGAPYLELASETYAIGPAAARESYLNQEALIGVLRRARADAVHPGYGFLSENAEFAARAESAGTRFIGPAPRWIEAMGHKTRARALAREHGLPVGRGSEVLPAEESVAAAAAREIGYPVLVKPAAGGGGIGMLPAYDEAQLGEALARARSMAQRGFANPEVYLEQLLERPRHIEFQVLGDRFGSVRHLFERDCSAQRRHQKVIEEAPAARVERAPVERIAERIAAMLQKMGYDNIGTVEMLMAGDGTFRFLEMNTRLQVEHGVTEEVTGIDLVQAQIRSAAGERLDAILPQRVALHGHAVQARVYAEDPKRFFPSPGKLRIYRPPQHAGVRVDTGYGEGCEVTPHYDPLLAKVIAHAPTRAAAIERLCDALRDFVIDGVKHNIPALLTILGSGPFRAGRVHTGIVAEAMS
jgi:acetyl-CoA carboxylase biotin carboxylase subunit